MLQRVTPILDITAAQGAGLDWDDVTANPGRPIRETLIRRRCPARTEQAQIFNCDIWGCLVEYLVFPILAQICRYSSGGAAVREPVGAIKTELTCRTDPLVSPGGVIYGAYGAPAMGQRSRMGWSEGLNGRVRTGLTWANRFHLVLLLSEKRKVITADRAPIIGNYVRPDGGGRRAGAGKR